LDANSVPEGNDPNIIHGNMLKDKAKTNNNNNNNNNNNEGKKCC